MKDKIIKDNQQEIKNQKQKVGLVLSGGSAYGFAHIGVIKVLIENMIPIDIVAGTSMGALVGGVYASGISVENMKQYLTKFSRKQIFDFNPFVLTDTGLLFGKKIIKYLKSIVGEIKIENCPIPFCAIAADLINGKKVVYKKGSLVSAIRASISIPGVFKPIKKGNHCLVDGGVCDNMPVTDARIMGADKIISVDVCSYYKPQNKMSTAIDIVLSATNLLTSNYLKAKQDKGDICIKVDQPDVSFEKFSAADIIKSIRAGEQATRYMIPQIKKLLKIK